MSQSNKCPHFDERTQQCDMLPKLKNQGAQVMKMMGCSPDAADWRKEFCSSSKWAECGVIANVRNQEANP